MAGHSKWANIKHKKSREDAKRGKIFTKLIREISVAAREGGSDPAANPRLRSLVEEARAANMPQENITRAIKKGSGELEGAHYEESIYEGYGPGGIALVIETLSDNKNRTVADLRHVFSKHGGSLASSGSVLWMFDRKGVVRIKKDAQVTEDLLIEKLMSCGIEDIVESEDEFSIVCDPASLAGLNEKVKEFGFAISGTSIDWVPRESMKVQDVSDEEKALKLLEILDDLDDVNEVYTNLG